LYRALDARRELSEGLDLRLEDHHSGPLVVPGPYLVTAAATPSGGDSDSSSSERSDSSDKSDSSGITTTATATTNRSSSSSDNATTTTTTNTTTEPEPEPELQPVTDSSHLEGRPQFRYPAGWPRLSEAALGAAQRALHGRLKVGLVVM
jgi:hypothetical protein